MVLSDPKIKRLLRIKGKTLASKRRAKIRKLKEKEE